MVPLPDQKDPNRKLLRGFQASGDLSFCLRDDAARRRPRTGVGLLVENNGPAWMVARALCSNPAALPHENATRLKAAWHHTGTCVTRPG